MKAYKTSLLNSITLIVFGLWGSMDYICGSASSWFPLIPVIFGVILLICHNGLKKENKIIAHIAVILTLLIFLAIFMPLNKAFIFGKDDAVLRISLMIIASGISLFGFIKSFIAARKK